MSTVPLIAVRTFPYAGSTVVQGQTFVAQSVHDATLLKAVGHAIAAPPEILDGVDDEAPRTPKRRRKPAEDV